MNPTLKQDLQSLICEGNVAKLPSTPLNDYASLKKTLLKACGKYKKNTFVFPCPAQTVVNKLINGENIDFKKEFQFFATPKDLAQTMVEYVVGYPSRVLEPSAGHGALIDAILEIRPDIQLDAVELSDINYDVLNDKYASNPAINLIKGDFLSKNLKPEYDLILANPPFTRNQDIDHVRKMHTLLKPGGRLISIMSLSWTFGTQIKQVEFREWIESEDALVIENGQGPFKSSGTNVNSVLVIIDK